MGLDKAEESVKRIENRVEKGGHDIPVADVNRRFVALGRIMPYCDEAVFFDNDNGFVEVAHYRNGEMVRLVDDCPAWLNELIQNIT